ncbi:hypothetical protein [Mucilaginibacter antarcticus]|uniref:DUF1508 domain-containing protein n=1 Tax=Mucilaginibacter antarcticus TaxID=1855725 RepID=A0ABW5XRJ9_9SPHI
MPRKFKKIYFVVEDNHIFSKYNYFSIETYHDRATAERICITRQQQAITDAQQYSKKDKPIPQFKVHAFYLVHESLF